MSDAEMRALRRAVSILLALSLIRWVAATVAPPPAGPDVDALAGLTESSTAAVADAERRARPLEPGERLDPNRAPAEELDRLPGVGPATAEAIVRARAGSAFLLPADLERVPGLGPASVARIAPYLDLDSPPVAPRSVRRPRRDRTDVNRATPEELASLPGIGPALAARIVEAREGAPFASAEDLLRVPGIGPATLERLLPLVRARPGG